MKLGMMKLLTLQVFTGTTNVILILFRDANFQRIPCVQWNQMLGSLTCKGRNTNIAHIPSKKTVMFKLISTIGECPFYHSIKITVNHILKITFISVCRGAWI